MATLPATFPIPEQQFTPSSQPTAGANVPAGAKFVDIKLTSSQWFTVTGTLDYRVDQFIGGQWVLGPQYHCAIGETRRNDGVTLPSIGFSIDPNTAQVRGSLVPSVNLLIGAVIKVS